MVGLQTLDLAIGVRVPASQPLVFNKLRATRNPSRPFCVPIVGQLKNCPLFCAGLGEQHLFQFI
jgi:hypothetical protein